MHASEQQPAYLLRRAGRGRPERTHSLLRALPFPAPSISQSLDNTRVERSSRNLNLFVVHADKWVTSVLTVTRKTLPVFIVWIITVTVNTNFGVTNRGPFEVYGMRA